MEQVLSDYAPWCASCNWFYLASMRYNSSLIRRQVALQCTYNITLHQTFSVFDTFLGGSVKETYHLNVILSNDNIVLSNMTVDFDRTAHCDCNHQCLTEFQRILTEQYWLCFDGDCQKTRI